MKKFFFTILTFILLAQQSIVWANNFSPNNNLAQQTFNQQIQARVILDDSFKPENSPGITFANPNEIKSSQNSNTSAQFGNFLLQIIAGALISVAAPIAIIIITVAGLMAVISHGNQGLIDKAKKALTWAIIGLVVIIFSWIIVRATISAVISTNGGAPAATAVDSNNKAPATGGVENGNGAPKPATP